MCGLVSYCGLKPADPDKLKILAIYNETRGKDSCGIFSGGKLIYGYKDNKMDWITDLLQNQDIPINKDWRTVIIHTRAATVGAKTLEGCHPFEYKKGNKRMFFAHNGTITNWKDLVKEAGLEPSDYISDSKAMGAIVFKEGNFKVFQKYKGAGAFLCADNHDKNTLWVYRGEAGGKEERPLYVWFDEKNQGAYISSMTVPLRIISGGGKVLTFKGNHLYKIVNGKIEEAHLLERPEQLHEKYVAPVNFNNPYYGTNRGGFSEGFDDGILRGKAEEFFNRSTNCGPKVVWAKGRYFRNGHLLDGVYKIGTKQFMTFPRDSDLLPGEKIVTAHFINGVLCSDSTSYEELRKKMEYSQKPLLWNLCQDGFFSCPFTIGRNQACFEQVFPGELINRVSTYWNNKVYKIPFTNATLHINMYGEIGNITFTEEAEKENNAKNNMKIDSAEDSSSFKMLAINLGIGQNSTREELNAFFVSVYPNVKVGVIKHTIEEALRPPIAADIVRYVIENLDWLIKNQPESLLIGNKSEADSYEDEEDVDDKIDIPVEEALDIFYSDFEEFMENMGDQLGELISTAEELGVEDPEIIEAFVKLKAISTDYKKYDKRTEDSNNGEKDEDTDGSDSFCEPGASC